MSKLFPYDIGSEPSLEPPPEDIEEVTLGYCDCCGEPIFEGDTYYALWDCMVCESCVDDARRCG